MNLLQEYTKGIIFEGTDIAFDHANELFLEEKLYSNLDKDLIIDGQEPLILSNHELLNGITQITIDGNISPYPDSVTPVNSISIADWNNAESAIILADSNKTIYFAFSVNSINEINSRNKLIANSIEFIIQSTSTQECGNLDNKDSVDISDLIYLINYLFKGGPELQCMPVTCNASNDLTQNWTIEDISNYIENAQQTNIQIKN